LQDLNNKILGKPKKKPIYDRIGFLGFMAKKPNFTEPNRSGLNRFSVRFGLKFSKFKLLGSVGFCSLNRTEPDREQPYL
jgi:hypothetical protein